LDKIAASSIVLITGIMASGKSTIAQLLAERLERSVHLRGDIFRKMIVSDRKEMKPQASQEQMDQLRLRYRITAQTADMYYEAGFTVIVQDVIIGPLLNDFIAAIKNRPLYVVVLCPNIATVSQRETTRTKKAYSSWTVEMMNDILIHDTPRVGYWMDNSELTAEQTVDKILIHGLQSTPTN
ncbi:MAG: AAA family ATPase, partial [Sphingobacterium sp.]